MKTLEFTREGHPIPDPDSISSASGLEGDPVSDAAESSMPQDVIDARAQAAADLGYRSWENMRDTAWVFSPDLMTLSTRINGIPLSLNLERLIEGDVDLSLPVSGLISADIDGNGVAKSLGMTLYNARGETMHAEDDIWWFGTSIASMDFASIGQSIIRLVNPLLTKNAAVLERFTDDDIWFPPVDFMNDEIAAHDLENFNTILEDLLQS